VLNTAANEFWEFHLANEKQNNKQMKKLLAIFSLLVAVALLFAQCKSTECTYKPKSARQSNVWMKQR
jgi:hypothetical protein